MKSSLLYFLFFVKIVVATAQSITPLWTRQDVAEGSTLYGVPLVMVDSFHNAIVCGNDYHPGPLNSFLTSKYDPNGMLLWQRKFDQLGNDFVISSATDNQGSIYVGGNTSLNSINGTLPRFIVIKYAPNGDSLWNYRFDGPTVGVNYITKVLLDSEQNLMVFGQYGDTVALQGGLFVAKVSPDGQELWRATYLDPVYGFGGIDVRWIGDRWVFWGKNYTASSSRYLAWQIGPIGQSLGISITEPDSDNYLEAEHIDNHGNIYISTWIKYRLVKYGISGQKIWEYYKIAPSSPSPFIVTARINAIETNGDGEVFVAGTFMSDSLEHRPLITKLNEFGALVWEHSVVVNNNPLAFPSQITWISPGLFSISGAIINNLDSNFYEIFLAFYDSNGFIKGNSTDLEGRHNAPTSLVKDEAFLYVAGFAYPSIFANPSKQILCKYTLSDLVNAHTAPLSLGQLTVWPNPATDWIRVQIPEGAMNKGSLSLELMDTAGKSLRNQQISGQEQFFDWSLEGLPAGAYVLVFKQNGLPTHTEQVIKP